MTKQYQPEIATLREIGIQNDIKHNKLTIRNHYRKLVFKTSDYSLATNLIGELVNWRIGKLVD